eukprot:Seg1841.8 transcript_id=Seg1841.8/GoldUCD/mRNA.D3Y31 product="hypothetical protein" protein_id=Seg1841.8/GoldUCD/D3Y31
MKYDLSVLFAREDAAFVRALAKGLEKINLSVNYRECLPRPILGQQPLQTAIKAGFSGALYGIVIISKEFFKMGFSTEDLDYLCDVLLMEEQILHPVWYNITDAQVSSWYPKLAMNIALRCPPETVDSMSRKFQVKLAGSADLQRKALTGFHSQIQYISPKIGTYRPPESQMPNHSPVQQRRTSEVSWDEGSISPKPNEIIEKSIDDELIIDCFDYNLREEIGNRLDVYLKKLSNWKDLAAIFGITTQSDLRQISDTEHPTINLLDVIAGNDVTVGQLKGALKKIDRYDVIDCIDRRLIKT